MAAGTIAASVVIVAHEADTLGIDRVCLLARSDAGPASQETQS